MSADILRILVVLLGVVVVAVVLIQQPKDGGMSAFTGGGGGASSTVFGAKGSGSFLFKLTAVSTLAFAILIIALVKITNSDLNEKVLSAPVAAEIADMPTTLTPNNDAIPGAEAAPIASNSNEDIPGAVSVPADAPKTEQPQD